jgi:hypothetical protein
MQRSRRSYRIRSSNIPKIIREARKMECGGRRLVSEQGEDLPTYKCEKCLRFNIRLPSVRGCF